MAENKAQRSNKKQEKEHALAVLYNKTIAYVMEHYMDADLNRFTISTALQCSTRQLSRAFEGRPATLKSSILLIRLHKGRELIRKNPKWPVAKVARRLHFYDAKHFTRQYKKHFNRLPLEDRNPQRE